MRLPTWLWRARAGWLAVGLLYVVAAVLALLLAVRMAAWSPLLITVAAAVAAAQCVLTALGSGEPAGVEVAVAAGAGEQVGVGALLDDAAVVEDEDEVGVADGGQAVGDDERGPGRPQG